MRTQEEIVNNIKSFIEETSLGLIKSHEISGSQKLLDDLGLDSLDYATVMIKTEQITGIKILEDSVVWSEIQTVDQLAQLFLSRQ